MGEAQNANEQTGKRTSKKVRRFVKWTLGVLGTPAFIVLILAFWRQESLPDCVFLGTGANKVQVQPSSSKPSTAPEESTFAPYIRFTEIVYTPETDVTFARGGDCFFWDLIYDYTAAVELDVVFKDTEVDKTIGGADSRNAKTDEAGAVSESPDVYEHPAPRLIGAFSEELKSKAWTPVPHNESKKIDVRDRYLSMFHNDTHRLTVSAQKTTSYRTGTALRILDRGLEAVEDNILQPVISALLPDEEETSNLGASNVAKADTTVRLRQYLQPSHGDGKLSFTVSINNQTVGQLDVAYETRPSLILSKADYDAHISATDGDKHLRDLDASKKTKTPFDWLNLKDKEISTNRFAKLFAKGSITTRAFVENEYDEWKKQADFEHDLITSYVREGFLGEEERIPDNVDVWERIFDTRTESVSEKCGRIARDIASDLAFNEYDTMLVMYTLYRHHLGFQSASAAPCKGHRMAEMLGFVTPTQYSPEVPEQDIVQPPDPTWDDRLEEVSTKSKGNDRLLIEGAVEKLTRTEMTLIYESNQIGDESKRQEAAFNTLLVNWIDEHTVLHFGCFNRHRILQGTRTVKKFSALIEVEWPNSVPRKSTIFWVDFTPDANGLVSTIAHRPATLGEVFLKVTGELPTGGVPAEWSDGKPPLEWQILKPDEDKPCRTNFLTDTRLNDLRTQRGSRHGRLAGIYYRNYPKVVSSDNSQSVPASN